MMAEILPQPVVSVIIPTHNRCAILKRTIEALDRQTFPAQQIEVLVVVDGSQDGTSEMLRCYRASFPLTVIEQASQGAAAARNRGAAQAKGSLLLFLDDDVVPSPGLVAAHVAAHQDQGGQVGIGPYLSVKGSLNGYFHSKVRNWWEAKFYELQQRDHRFSYQDLLSGNLSMEAATFVRVGGFNPNPIFWSHEDYELGIRLIKAQVTFKFVSEAVADHYETMSINRTLGRARQEGRADVAIGRQYPDLRSTLPVVTSLKSMKLRYRAALLIFPVIWSTFGRILAKVSSSALSGLEFLRLSRYWNHLYSFLHWYWYWWGVIDGLKNWRSIAAFVRNNQANVAPAERMIEINLDEGLDKARQCLDKERPAGVKIWYGNRLVGVVPPQPGFEPLRGVHLTALLTTTLAVPLLETLALAGVLTPLNGIDDRELAGSVKSKSGWFGPLRLSQMWYEQYTQWNQLQEIKAQPLAPSPDRAKLWSTQSEKINYSVAYSESPNEQ